MSRLMSITTTLIVIIAASYCIVASLINYKKTKHKCFIFMIIGAVLLIVSTLLGLYNMSLYRTAQITKQQSTIFALINGLMGLIAIILFLKGYLFSKKQKLE